MVMVVLKTVATQVGMDEKKLRKLLRDKKFSKPGRQWIWDEGSEDLASIIANAKAWEKEDDKPVETVATTETPPDDVPTPADGEPDADPEPEAQESKPSLGEADPSQESAEPVQLEEHQESNGGVSEAQ